jgi:hypothetical protein
MQDVHGACLCRRGEADGGWAESGPAQQNIYGCVCVCVCVRVFKILWFPRIFFYTILYNISLYFMS